MRWLAAGVPILSLAVVTILAAMPWGVGAGAGATRGYLPALVIHVWALRRPRLLPEWAAFLSGLTVDAMTLGPLGLWALVYLAVYAVTLLSHNAVGHATLATGALAALAGLAVAGLAAAGLIGVSTWSVPNVTGTVMAAVAAVVAYPILALLVLGHDRLYDGRVAGWPGGAALRRPGESGP